MVVLELHSQDEFTAKLQEAGNKLVAVDFCATWCGPCKIIKPEFAKFSEEFANMIFCSIDVDEVEDVAQSIGVTALPTFVFYKHGKEVKRVIGARKAELCDMIKEVRENYSGPSKCEVRCQCPM